MQNQVINISIPNQLLKQADQIARSEYRNRSELFREALRNYILTKNKLNEIYDYAQKQAVKKNINPKQLNNMIYDWRKAKK